MTEEYTIPKIQKAVVVVTKGESPIVKIDTKYPVPECGEDEMLVRLTSSGVCHSDLSLLQAHWDIGMQVQVAGHEGSGYIVKHGSKVTGTEQYPLGTKVGVPLVSNPCRTCHACGLPDGEVYCPKSPFYGSFVDGTWQQYITIKEKYIIPIPEVKDTTLVGPILCGGVTAYKALMTSGKKAGQWVVITGAGGGLGSMCIQYATSLGLRVIGIDAGSDKEDLVVNKLGADAFIDFLKTKDVVAKVKEITGGRGADAAIMFAPVESSYNQAIDYLGLQGVIVCVGLPKAGAELKFPPSKLILTGIQVRGSFVGTRQDIIQALEFVARGKVVPPVQVKPMEDIQSILDDMINGRVSGRMVIDLT
ncbi:hypothetical protein BABINDRAFT_169071 [Babjeviella inositovora NRRL Y-12698]|uniref:Enoyl reductase (ER) domain-containing protein n=1 Tax=Babjeviella inositovora NRRL Y-12698 TaxID=984486 RepID=A0A1E3QKC8_9ASCO|nr:uncharacterized protein BABINDRAFT_169071 [Babjeviella inositovora NRRL Y-12698]ODQ77457.1 hypothetical protein BABINDRAFT_169071 [Babjeviella inositovora NRRL Y-12698]